MRRAGKFGALIFQAGKVWQRQDRERKEKQKQKKENKKEKKKNLLELLKKKRK